MKKKHSDQSVPNSYAEALDELKKILDELKTSITNIDEISKYTERAQFLLAFCQERIRKVEKETNDLW